MVATPTLWKPLSKVNPNTDTSVQVDGQIAALGDGGYVVVWTDASLVHNPFGTTIVMQKYDALGQKVGGERTVVPFLGSNQISPAVTALPDGGIAIAYVNLVSNGQNDILARRFDVNLNPITNSHVFIDVSSNNTIDPSISALPDGSYFVSFTLANSDTSHTFDSRLVSPTNVVTPAANTGADTDFSEVAALSDGFRVAVWESALPGEDSDIRMWRLNQPFGPGFVFGGLDDAVAESDPDIAALKGDRFVVVWTDAAGDLGGTSSGIRATVFGNNGSVISGNFLVNTTQAGNQNEASVVALLDGGFLVCWEDDSANLVRAQRFTASGGKIGAEFTVKVGVGPVDSPEATLLADGRIAFALGDPAGGLDVMTSIWDARNMPTPADFSRDLASDILWRNVGGEVNIWDLRDGVPVGGHGFGVVANSWHIEDTGDFNGDGYTDILWRNDSGDVNTWQMRDGVPVGGHGFGMVGNSWHIEGIGDFNGDGHSDILWRNDSGEVNTWDMRNGVRVGGHGFGIVGNNWHIQGAGDFNGDGYADILWRNDGGQAVVWDMRDGVVVGSHIVGLVANSWHIEDTGDFNGDGHTDILWRHISGEVNTWELHDGVRVGGQGFGVVANSWHIEDTRDFNGDGHTDILWRNDSGEVNTWELHDGVRTGGFSFGVISNDWEIV
jgi:FG-GAP-like repeat/FG-GAP repeat